MRTGRSAKRLHTPESKRLQNRKDYDAVHAWLSPIENDPDGQYEDRVTSVFESVETWGIDRGGLALAEDQKKFRADLSNRLTAHQMTHVIKHVNADLADAKGLDVYRNKKTGQVSFKSRRTHRFTSLAKAPFLIGPEQLPEMEE